MVLASQALLSDRDSSLPQVRLTLAFSCEAVWHGPGQAQRLSGPAELEYTVAAGTAEERRPGRCRDWRGSPEPPLARDVTGRIVSCNG